MLKRVVLIACIVLVQFPSCSAQQQPTVPKKELSLHDQVALVRQAVIAQLHRAHRNERFTVEGTNPEGDPRFRTFQGLFLSRHYTSAVIGSYTVDQFTGDIWSQDTCEELDSTAIRQLQKTIRAHLHVSSSEYTRMQRDRGPVPHC